MIEGLEDILKADSSRTTKVDAVKTIEEYVLESDWRVKANANTTYSHASLVNNSAGKLIANFWLDKVYTKKEGDAHRNGDYHIHDLDNLSAYCCGHDLAKLLREGFNGVTGRVSSRPPKHFRSALDQMVNYVGILQAEWAGAQAFSSYDTYLAPYVFYDKYMRHMAYNDLKESTLSFVYGLNVPSRWGQCVPSTYRCLRADGKWVGPDDLKVGDEIYVVDMKTGLLKKDKLTKVNTFAAPEKMHRYEAGDNSGFAFEVTDNHRVIYTDPDFTSTVIKNKNSEHIKIAPSASLMSKGTVSIPVAPWGKINADHFQGEEYDISDDLLEFIVFIMCDGAIVAQKGKSPYLDWCKSGKRWGTERFKELCKKFGLTYTERGADNGFSNEAKEYRLHVSDKATKIIEMMGKDKHFMPEWFKDLSPRQCYIVIDTWAKLDGYFDGKHWRMQGDTEDIQEMLAYLSVKAGKAAGMMDVNIKDRKNLTKYTAVYLSRFRDCEISEVSPSTDKVWCPTTNTGTFVCMTDDGHIFLTGNSPFSNVTIDWTVPNDLKDQFPMYQDIPYFEAVYKDLTEEDKATPEYECFITAARNKFTKEEYKDIMDCCGPDDDKDLMVLRSLTYKHFQPEMDMINKAFYEVLTEGDPNGLQFTFPIPTINVTEEFDWNSPNADLLFTNTGKYGHSYFQNFIGSQYKRNPETGQLERDPNAYSPNDVRSMCCRLQLDKTQIRKKGGGLFGADSQTGSIGVVTINAPRLGYLHKGDKPGMLKALLRLMELARGTLQKKRRFVQEMFDRGLYPYSARYINTLDTFFSTIGILGINEMIRNFTGDEYDITGEYGQEFAKEVLNFMNKHILRFQEEDDVLYNLEATPAEGTTYRLAKEDLRRYTDIIHAGTPEHPYYTNSSQLPVNFTDDAFAALDLQDDLQCKYTGGTVLHLYMAEAISDPNICKALVKKVLTNYRLPYISITPTFSSCPVHGYISGAHEFCPYCDQELIAKHKADCSCDNH